MKKLVKNKILFQKTSIDQEPQTHTVFAGHRQAKYWRGEIVPCSYMAVVDYSQQAIYDQDSPEVRVIVRKDAKKRDVLGILENIQYFIESQIEEMNEPVENSAPPHNVYTFVPPDFQVSDVVGYGQEYFCECPPFVDLCCCGDRTMQNEAKEKYDFGMDYIINKPIEFLSETLTGSDISDEGNTKEEK